MEDGGEEGEDGGEDGWESADSEEVDMDDGDEVMMDS